MTDAKPITCPAPAPWNYDYNPYYLQDGTEISAFEICDADQNRLFTTEELTPEELQEANARLAASAPCLRDALRACVRLLADFDESEGEEGDAYRAAVAVLEQAQSTKT